MPDGVGDGGCDSAESEFGDAFGTEWVGQRFLAIDEGGVEIENVWP